MNDLVPFLFLGTGAGNANFGTLAAKDREIFRFPPAGHPYYTPQTLKALAKQYPGWNVNEYS